MFPLGPVLAVGMTMGKTLVSLDFSYPFCKVGVLTPAPTYYTLSSCEIDKN